MIVINLHLDTKVQNFIYVSQIMITIQFISTIFIVSKTPISLCLTPTRSRPMTSTPTRFQLSENLADLSSSYLRFANWLAESLPPLQYSDSSSSSLQLPQIRKRKTVKKKVIVQPETIVELPTPWICDHDWEKERVRLRERMF